MWCPAAKGGHPITVLYERARTVAAADGDPDDGRARLFPADLTAVPALRQIERAVVTPAINAGARDGVKVPSAAAG